MYIAYPTHLFIKIKILDMSFINNTDKNSAAMNFDKISSKQIL